MKHVGTRVRLCACVRSFECVRVDGEEAYARIDPEVLVEGLDTCGLTALASRHGANAEGIAHSGRWSRLGENRVHETQLVLDVDAAQNLDRFAYDFLLHAPHDTTTDSQRRARVK